MMKHRSAIPGGELEAAVLAALWELGSAQARDIHRLVGEPRALVYTTTAKVLDRLHAKGLVSRGLSGNAYVYKASVRRELVEQARARSLLGPLLGSEPRRAMATLVEALESLDPELLDELSRAVKARRKRRGP